MPANSSETEAPRGGWSARQHDRRIGSRFYERTALSRNEATMLTKGQQARTNGVVLPEGYVNDRYVFECPDLKIRVFRDRSRRSSGPAIGDLALGTGR